jgi:signal peptidase I
MRNPCESSSLAILLLRDIVLLPKFNSLIHASFMQLDVSLHNQHFKNSSRASMSDLTKSSRARSGFFGTVLSIAEALIIAAVIRTLLFQPFDIPSGSMEPTLLVGDYLFVSKYSYGYSHYSIPFSPPLFSGRVFAFHRPQRGDVVVFRLPSDTSVESAPEVRVPQWRETLPNGVSYNTLNCRSFSGFPDNTGVYTVPPDHYFMMGDNRENSQDSRFPEVGYVPFENMIGPAQIIFFSLADETPAWQFWRWPWEVRWSRLITTVR